MNLIDIIDYATDKKRFQNLEGYTDFCSNFLHYIEKISRQSSFRKTKIITGFFNTTTGVITKLPDR